MAKDNLRAEFTVGVVEKSGFPESIYPEVAFAGRSNVGKSSLINSIVFRKNLAFTSSTPGKTQEINFYLVNDDWCLVDMPGFGFATKGKIYREMWSKLNYEYLLNRNNLTLTCVLIDARHDPMQNDIELIETLESYAKKYLIILTKCDKLSKTKIIERKNQIEHLVSMCNYNLEVLPYSSVNRMGREELLAIIKREVKEWKKKQKS